MVITRWHPIIKFIAICSCAVFNNRTNCRSNIYFTVKHCNDFPKFSTKNLFNALSSGDGEKIFCELYSKEQYECQINNIFAGATDTYLAVIFAGIFSAVMSFFEIWMDMPTIKIFFIIFIKS